MMHSRMFLGRVNQAVNLDDFIITIDTTLGDGLNQMRLPVQGSNMVIDWGDGIVETHTQTSTPSSSNWITHTYASAGTYDIKIGNTIESIRFNNEGDKEKPIQVKQWGTGDWTSLERAWWGCSNITAFPNDPIPFWSNVTNLSSTWRICSSLTTAPDISNLINVTNLSDTWRDCTSLTTAPDVSNLVNVTNLFGTWYSCKSLTTAPDVSNLANVTNLSGTWFDCRSLTTAPDVSNLINVTNLLFTWFRCTSLTTAPDVSNLINVTKLSSTWLSCISISELPVIGFHIENVTNANRMAEFATATTSNYDAILVDFEARLQSLYPRGVGYPNSGLDIHFGNSKYTLGSPAETARASLSNPSTFGWNITDGGGI